MDDGNNGLVEVIIIIPDSFLHGLARKLQWPKPELIEGLSVVGIVEF